MIRQHSWRSWFRLSEFALGAAVLLMLASPVAWAQLNVEHNTVVTFSAPVEVPGSTPQVLPAGRYTFKVVDSKVNRNIVQISNEDQTHVYTTILAIPIRREVETDETVMTFDERAAGKPQALRAWFYPHEKMGQEFAYSKERATELAKSSNSPVRYSEGTTIATKAPTAAAVPVAAVTPAPILTMLPTGESRQSAAPTQQEQEPVQIASTLPQTSGNLPFIAMIGCLFLVAGIAIRKLCVR